MENVIKYLNDWLDQYGMTVLVAVVTFIIGRIVISILTGLIKKIMNRTGVDETLTKFVLSLARMMMMLILVIVVLDQLGIETTSFIAILGAAGLAVGFALQSSLSNFASGVMLIIFKPFKAGDFVEAGGTMGMVSEVTIFNTVMLSPDNKKIIVPNGQITGGNITNFSAMDTRRVDLVFGIGYNDDLKKAKELLGRIVGEDSRVLNEPATTIAVGELADSSVNFLVRPWVKSADYWGVYWDLTEKVKLTFDAEGISIPFPQQDVHMYQENQNS